MILDCGICRIRSWRLEDEPALCRYANNRLIWLNLRDAFPHPYTSADAKRWIGSALRALPETEFAIDVEGEAVGGIGVRLLTDIERLSGEVGYWLGEPLWGRGIMTEAVRAFCRYSFEAFRIIRIFAVPFSHNVPSIRVLEKAGFEREGLLRRSAVKEGIILDQVLMACRRE